MSNQTDHTIVRLRVPPELKTRIEKSAEENNRSQSAEMVARLEESFNAEELRGPRMKADLLTFFSGILVGYQSQLSKLKAELKKLDQSSEAVDTLKKTKLEHEIFKMTVTCDELKTLEGIITETPPPQTEN
ncbi:Arc family DNA-binding protein [Acinetobacter lwoffii]|uniref:Arc family DNA-binding protein n=1 Tax=Acinetobacter lwoffii TaxID=28090 RepID=UPI003891B583